jgi:hypothetical protein
MSWPKLPPKFLAHGIFSVYCRTSSSKSRDAVADGEIEVRVSRFLRGSAILAVSAGLVMSGVLPAVAAATPTITVAAQSEFKPVSKDVFIAFHQGGAAQAELSGKVTGAASTNVLRLLAQPFPFSKPAVRVQAQGIAANGKYAFVVKPSIATRYTVELFSDAAATSKLAAGTRKTIFVIAGGSASAPKKCGRPVCTEVFHLKVVLPPSAIARESHKHWFVYLGLHLMAGSKLPSEPKTLTLHTNTIVAKPTKVSADTYRTAFKFSFRVGNDSYRLLWAPCTKDTASKDGVGLPGHHGCGNKKISSKISYLG